MLREKLLAMYGGAQGGDCVGLRRRTKGSKIGGEIGIKVAGLRGQNEHHFARGRHEIYMEQRLGEACASS